MSEYGDFPNIPKNLISAIDEIGSQRKFAKKVKINDSYVNRLLKHGIEPTDKTERGRVIRVKLFLPKRKFKPCKSKRIFDMSAKELLWRLRHRKEMQ